MNLLRFVRYALQLTASVIFSYQMTFAIRKYFAATTIPTTEMKNLRDSTLPYIYFCEKHQLNLAHLVLNGYSLTLPEYLKGKVFSTNDSVSWAGNDNLTIAEIMEEMFTPNNNDTDPYPDIYYHHYSVFKIFNGFCKQLLVSETDLATTVLFETWERYFQVCIMYIR